MALKACDKIYPTSNTHYYEGAKRTIHITGLENAVA